MESYVFRLGAAFATATPFCILLPGSFGDTSNDAWLATGTVDHISIAVRPQLTAVLPVYVRVFDALVETAGAMAMQQLRGGTGTDFAGKANLGAAYTAGRTFAHPTLGTINTDISLPNVAAIPTELSGLREVFSGQAGEFAALAASVPEVGNPVRLDVDKECLHGIVVVLENRSGVDITGSATVPSLNCTVHYQPRVMGRQRQRTSTYPNRAAAMY
jgi:hypothetical protein